MIKKIWQYRWVLRSLIKTLYFNFHYLPFKQAIKLPILLYKPKLLKCKGTIEIKGHVKFGMIKLGPYSVSIYPNTGIVFENHGGKITFNGNCSIGNNSFISIGKTGNVVFGKNFCSTSSLKLASYSNIVFKDNVLCGWNCMFIDTDFHKLTLVDNTNNPKGTILAGPFSMISKNYVGKIPENCLLAGCPAKVVVENIRRVKNIDTEKLISEWFRNHDEPFLYKGDIESFCLPN